MIQERLQFVVDTLLALGHDSVSIQHGFVYVSKGSAITIRLYVDRSNVVQFEYFTVSTKANPLEIANFLLNVVNATAYLFTN